MTQKYQVKFYTGDYSVRQKAANAAGAICYVEGHFNAAASQKANYSCVVVASNSSEKSRSWGRDYAHAIAEEFGTKVGGQDGLLIGGYNGRGNANLVHTNMPAILLEPLFCSNPEQATIIKSDAGQNLLAQILVETIKKHFPDGGLVAFSVGHKGKTSKPHDMGASVHGGGTEAQYAEIVLRKAAAILTDSSIPELNDPDPELPTHGEDEIPIVNEDGEQIGVGRIGDDGQTMVHIRFAEKLGFKVDWTPERITIKKQ